MTGTDNILPDWISRQATLDPNVMVHIEQTNENSFWYLLTVCCPLLFDSYAIVLHPFWINWKVKELVESGLIITDEQTDEADFKKLSWRQFFKLHGKDFDLKSANKTKIEINEQIHLNKWPSYLWFPGEGNCEMEELGFILNELKNHNGDTLANYYYCLFKTEKWNNQIIYRGKLSEFEELQNKADVRGNPTAIYPDNKEWCIVSDYDLPFTYIGGSKVFIDSVTTNTEFDIFKIEPIFREKTGENSGH